jgi:hypothetical protein
MQVKPALDARTSHDINVWIRFLFLFYLIFLFSL